MTKDGDFVERLERHGRRKSSGSPCGSTSDAALRKILTANFQEALRRLDAGDEFRHESVFLVLHDVS